MADSLRDQLLKSGIVKQVREESRAADSGSFGRGAPSNRAGNSTVAPNRVAAGKKSRRGGKASGGGRPNGGAEAGRSPPRAGGAAEIDLAKAYAIRAQTEANERKLAAQAAAEQARVKRERKQQIQTLLQGSTIAQADSDQVRHFEYGGKIRRVHVDSAQLAALNAGELGVVQQNGRYLLVRREIAEKVRAIDAHQLALLVDPGQAAVDEDGVPADLMW